MQFNNYWSSTTNANNTDNAWIVNMWNGNVNNNNKSNNNYVWPVRSGKWQPPLFSFQSLYSSYRKCRKNKRNTINALRFEINAEEKLFDLSRELESRTYRPARSVCFVVERPKMREIIAADFRDRVIHHLLVTNLEKIYEPIFIFDSYSCRNGKGVHRAVERLNVFIRKGGLNGRRKLYYVHLDIKNFFMTIDKGILYGMIEKKVKDEELLWLAHTIIFHDPTDGCIIKGNREILKHIPPHKSLFHSSEGKGLPIGNLTSQFFANLYLNELDQFAKHALKAKHYLRYCDDMILLGESPEILLEQRERMRDCAEAKLRLSMSDKFSRVAPVSNGIDFLGYIVRPDYRLVRRRAVNNLRERLNAYEKNLTSVENKITVARYDFPSIERLRAVIASYWGHFKWADTHKLKKAIINRYGFLKEYFVFDKMKVELRYPDPGPFRTIRGQYRYFAEKFKGAVLFFQAGCFYEFYDDLKDEVKEILRLKRIRQSRRGVTYGFPIKYGKTIAERLVKRGMPVVFIHETDHYLTRIKERLPFVKMT